MQNVSIPAITHEGQVIDLPSGYSIVISLESDDSQGTPWENSDGHGIVSDWTTRDKRAGELVLCTDRDSSRFYDFAEAVKIARRDKWGLCDEEKVKLAAKLGRQPTAREITAESVRRDFEFLRGWCNDEWRYVGVIATLNDPDGNEVDNEALWGVEDCGDYWKEVAHENAERVAKRHASEQSEAHDAACRDIETA